MWANKWKMPFNPDPSKQAQEAIFSRKSLTSNIILMKRKMKAIRALELFANSVTFFLVPHLDYSDVIYDQPENELFSSQIESVQYNASLVSTGAIRGTSQEKLY